MQPRPAIAWRGLALVSTAFAIALIAASGGDGYHRDELYFIAIGAHPAFGYVDQPPLAPLLAHAMDSLFGHSLVWLRLPAALAGALVVLVTGLIAREFGAMSGAQMLAAGSMAVSAVLVAVSHLATTSCSTCWDGLSCRGSSCGRCAMTGPPGCWSGWRPGSASRSRRCRCSSTSRCSSACCQEDRDRCSDHAGCGPERRSRWCSGRRI